MPAKAPTDYLNISATALCSAERKRALTLLEVMLSLALMVLIAGGVVAIVQSALVSTTLARNTFEDQQAEGIVFSHFRYLFLNLAPATTLETTPNPSGNISQQLQFNNAPELFSWGKGREGPPDTQVLLTTEQAKDGTYRLILEKRLLHPSRNFIRKELVLLDRLPVLEWSFHDPKERKWRNDWRDTTRRPDAIRMTLQITPQQDVLNAVFTVSPAEVRPTSASIAQLHD